MRFGKNLTLAAVAFMLWSLSYNLTAPLLPLLARQLGASPVGVGLVATAGALGAVVLIVPVALLSDRMGRRTALLVGWGASAVGVLMMWPARVWWALLPGAFFSMSGVAALPALNAFALEELPDRDRARGFSLLYAASPLGALGGSAVSGVLATHLGLQATTGAAGLCLVVATAALLPITEVRPGFDERGDQTLTANPAGTRQSTLAKLAFAAVAGGGFLLLALPGSFVVPYLTEVGHQTLTGAGLSVALLSGAQLGWSLLFSMWPRTTGRVRLGSGPAALTLSVAPLQAIGVCLVANAAFGLLMPAGVAGAAIVALMLRGSQFTLQSLGSALLGDVVARGPRLTTQLTGFSAILGAGAAAAPVVGGWLYGLAPAYPFWTTGIAGAAGSVALMLVLRVLPKASPAVSQ